MSGPFEIANMFGIDRDLVLEFSCTFSRFEYALKRAGFATGGCGRVSADWDCFGKTLRKLSSKQLAPVLNSCEHLRQKPPQKQVLRGGRLAWSNGLDKPISDIEQILIYVRRVRNNLFHGGKFPDPDGGPVEEVARNKELIQNSLAVLHAVLELPGVEIVAQNFKPEPATKLRPEGTPRLHLL